MRRPPKDIGASVRARLLQLARDRGEEFQLVLTRYANERLLYRLARSEYQSRFVLKGAALFTIWTSAPFRTTRDVDFLGFGDSGVEPVRRVFTDLVAIDTPEDGVVFDPETLVVTPIREDQEYGGVRVTMRASISGANVRLQIDVGFGDAITPDAVEIEYPVLLDFPAPRLRAYPRETVVAEKLQAIVHFGLVNTRMKDLYDLATLSRMFEFDGDVLVRAIRATFERRGTRIPDGLPVGLSDAFASDPAKHEQWAAFTRKTAAYDAGSLPSAVGMVATFAARPLAVAAAREVWEAYWPPGGPWADHASPHDDQADRDR